MELHQCLILYLKPRQLETLPSRGRNRAKSLSGAQAMDTDDLEPKRTKPAPKNLDPMSVEELNDYVASLRAEIARVEANITAKSAHLAAAANLFKAR